MKGLCVILMGLCLLGNFTLALANSDSRITLGQEIKEILSTLGEIIKHSMRLAEAEREGLDNHKHYMKDRYSLRKRRERFREKIRRSAEKTGRECDMLQEPITERVQDIIREIERTLRRMEQRRKRQRQGDAALSI